jgi:hypothetical protein
MTDPAASTRDHDDPEAVVRATKAWLERAVIGLGLCPFARRVHLDGRIRYRVSDANSAHALERDLRAELLWLQAANPADWETTLLIHPFALRDFLDYNDFLATADAIVSAMGLAGALQIASFHPRYRFAGTREDDIDNYTNRSPHPMLQLLREASVEQAVVSMPDPSAIYKRNIETLRQLGHEGWNRLFAEVPPEQ